MDWVVQTIIIVTMLISFFLIGVPVAFALGATSVLGIILFVDISALSGIANTTWGTTNSFVLTAAPLFMLMSEVISSTGIGKELFNTMEKWFGRLPGGIGIGSIMSSALFGAVSGTAVGVAAIVGRMAIPEMLKRNYDPGLSAATIACSSGLGMVIPPSLPLIIYGVVAEQSVGELFLAGIFPGLMAAGLLSIYFGITARKYIDTNARPINWIEKLQSLIAILPTLLLIVAVIGSIYVGFCTPTEAAGVGALGAIVLAMGYKKLTFQIFIDCLKNTTKLHAMLLMIVIGASLFGFLLTSLRIPHEISSWVIALGISKWVVFLFLMIAYLLLGMFLEVTSIVLITIPIVFPIITALGFNPIWFAIVLMLNMCIAVVTPPVGLCTYMVKSIAPDIPLPTIVKNAIPFMLVYLFSIAILCVFPQIALFIL